MGISDGAIAGIVLGAIVFISIAIIIVACVVVRKHQRKRRRIRRDRGVTVCASRVRRKDTAIQEVSGKRLTRAAPIPEAGDPHPKTVVSVILPPDRPQINNPDVPPPADPRL